MRLKLVELRGERFTLEPAQEEHRDEFRRVLDCDEEGWSFLPRSGFGESFPGFWSVMTDTPGRLAYVVRDGSTGNLVGTSSFVDVDAQNGTVEIGGTWFRPDQRGSVVNPATKLLMLAHAFDGGAERVQFKVDTRNLRSMRALARLGAVHEGIIRKHLVTWTGFRRDSAVLSILVGEWPDVRASLLERLCGKESR